MTVPSDFVLKTAPWTYSWTLNKTSDVMQSKNFFVSELNCTWCFRLIRRDGLLYLCHLGAGSLPLNLHVVLEYWDKTEAFDVKKLRKQTADPPYSLYLLATGKYGILVANCEFILSEDLKDKGTLIGFSSLSKDLHNLFLNEDDSDIIIRVGEHGFPAHKAIIKARSPVFYAMLNHDMNEKLEGIINIPDSDPDVFRDFLLYLYSGKLDNISLENVFEFFRISDKYGVTEMKDGCVEFILDKLSIDIFVDVISLATTYNEKKLFTAASEFFTDFEKDILESDKCKKFVSEDPSKAKDIFMKMFQNASKFPNDISKVLSITHSY